MDYLLSCGLTGDDVGPALATGLSAVGRRQWSTHRHVFYPVNCVLLVRIDVLEGISLNWLFMHARTGPGRWEEGGS